MTVTLPIHYTISSLPGRYLAFRTEHTDGRLLLSLVPDTQEQHPLDVVACFADEPRLAVAPEPAPVQAKPQNGALTSPE